MVTYGMHDSNVYKHTYIQLAGSRTTVMKWFIYLSVNIVIERRIFMNINCLLFASFLMAGFTFY